jgi:hypothetical protein
MNYHTIPTNPISIQMNVSFKSTRAEPYLPHTNIIIPTSNKSLQTYINPYEFVQLLVPHILHPSYFDFVELFQSLHLSRHFTKPIQVANYTNHTELPLDDIPSICHVLDIFQTQTQMQDKYDLMVFQDYIEVEHDLNIYVNNHLRILRAIIQNMNIHGMCIIPIDNLSYKPMIDIVCIYSSMFDKVQLTKPMVSNIFQSNRYLVCKNYLHPINLKCLVIEEGLHIHSLIDNEISRAVMNRIEESNLIIAQQQLDALDQLFFLENSKNQEERMDQLKKINTQKCLQWCEKYQLSHAGKPNIFL